MKIKEILDEIGAISGTNDKMAALRKYEDNDLLKEVLYLAHSPRMKYYIKQIPSYVNLGFNHDSGYTMSQIVAKVRTFSDRELTGGSAINYLTALLTNSHVDDAYVLERIIDKSTKIGMGTTNINKIFPKLIEKTPYQGAKSFSEDLAKKLFNGKPVRSDIKMDGRYANAIIRDGEVELISRQGEITHVGDARFLQELALFPDGVLNGELTIDGLDRYTANGIVASIVDIEKKRDERTDKVTEGKVKAFEKKHGSYTQARHNIRFTVWDRITIEDYFETKSVIPYETRRGILVKLLEILPVTKVTMVESKVVYTYEDAIAHFQMALARGEEGTILKSTIAGWKNGKPTWQIKMKLDISIDLRVIGFEYGEKGTKNENVYSTINLETSCGTLRTNASGMKEVMMNDITERSDDLIGTIVEIRCSGLSQDSRGNWSTLHPSVVELRDDKNTCDSLESAQEIENMAKTLE